MYRSSRKVYLSIAATRIPATRRLSRAPRSTPLLVAGLCALLMPPGYLRATSITLGTNAIVNGDAESGVGATGVNTVPLPNWTVSGSLTAVKYGAAGFPDAASPGPVDRGLNFFGGGIGASASASQSVDVSNVSAQIDANTVSFLFSGYFGGFSNQGDNALLTSIFLDASSVSLGSDTIGPVTPAERGDVTGMLFRSDTGLIPVGTRSINFVLSTARASGSYDDGYADNLSFVADVGPLADTPEPGSLLLMGAGLACIPLIRRSASTFSVRT